MPEHQAQESLQARLYERSDNAEAAARTLAIQLASAGIGGMFVLITSEDFMPQTVDRIFLSVGGFLFALTMACGLFSMVAESRNAFFDAVEIAASRHGNPDDGDLQRQWRRWSLYAASMVSLTLISLGFSAIVAAAYVLVLVWRGG